MKLVEAVQRLSRLNREGTIYVRRPWTGDAECSVVMPDREPKAAGFAYFLEVDVAFEVLEAFGKHKPTTDEKLRALIFYARNDAWPNWVARLRRKARPRTRMEPMKLVEAVEKLSKLEEEDEICVRRPWTGDAECVVVMLDKDGNVPKAAKAAGFECFLSVSTAVMIQNAFGKRKPTTDERLQLVIHYAKKNDFPKWVYEGGRPPPRRRSRPRDTTA